MLTQVNDTHVIFLAAVSISNSSSTSKNGSGKKGLLILSGTSNKLLQRIVDKLLKLSKDNQAEVSKDFQDLV